jgi:HD-GYP domain-containing protein (c-di-GMP phosphodiesterase class II)
MSAAGPKRAMPSTTKRYRDTSLEVIGAVRHHHEYLDGSGYPDGIGGSEITGLVRMLTISDIFAALIESRSYKPTLSRERAYDILHGMEGKLEKPLLKAFGEVALTR